MGLGESDYLFEYKKSTYFLPQALDAFTNVSQNCWQNNHIDKEINE